MSLTLYDFPFSLSCWGRKIHFERSRINEFFLFKTFFDIERANIFVLFEFSLLDF